MRFLKTLFIFFVLLAAIAGGWRYAQHARQAASSAQKTVQPQVRDVIEAVYATGEVEPKVWLQISPQVTARFMEVLVDDGSQVLAGDILARADDAVERAKLREYESHLQELHNEYNRNRALSKQGYISKKRFDEATSDWREVQSRIENQKKLTERLSLASPIAGVVLRRDIEPGEVKTPADRVFTIGQLAPLRVTAEVDEEDILRVKPGQRALLKTDALEEEILEGVVAEVTPKGDPVNKNFRVRIDLPADTPLLIGMTTEVNVVTAHRAQVLTVPVEAVGDGKVWRMKEGAVTSIPVRTGLTDGQVVEIISGLEAGDAILPRAP